MTMTKINDLLINTNGKRVQTDNLENDKKRLRCSNENVAPVKPHKYVSKEDTTANQFNEEINRTLNNKMASKSDISLQQNPPSITNSSVLYVNSDRKNVMPISDSACTDIISSTDQSAIPCITLDTDSDDDSENSNFIMNVSSDGITVEYSKQNWPVILRMLQDPISGIKLFESILMQKIALHLTDTSSMGKDRYLLDTVKQREQNLKNGCLSLRKEINEIRIAVLEDKQRLAKLKNHSRPIYTTTGVQATLDNNEKESQNTLAELRKSESRKPIVTDSSYGEGKKEFDENLETYILNDSSTKQANQQVIDELLKPQKVLPKLPVLQSQRQVTEIPHKHALPLNQTGNDCSSKSAIVTSQPQIKNTNHTMSTGNMGNDEVIQTLHMDGKITPTSGIPLLQPKVTAVMEHVEISNNLRINQTVVNGTSSSQQCVRDNQENLSMLKPVPLAIPLPIAIPLPVSNDDSSSRPAQSLHDSSGITYQPPPVPKITLELTKDRPHPAVMLLWDLDKDQITTPIKSFEVYSYELWDNAKKPKQWVLIGEVKALPLPMTCTLKLSSNKDKRFYFTVRARDVSGKFGPFSQPECVPLS
ncbi:activating transcription factor 7-interacting protein 1-like [Adelges cooleyi]|uniref:activating transcription factor 7-interacting protein 1-like n=1 Tax=Adelges cooleyi TaxID=133065 RepID=UPI0021805EBC|nr:activating transcription factor 7-interacting protein 1-like [Adelges cooleyi]